MGDLQRSAVMSYLQVACPPAAAEDFVHTIGKTGCMMFTDLNRNLQNIERRFMKDIIRLKEAEGTVDEIEGYLADAGLPPLPDLYEADLLARQTHNNRLSDVEQELQDVHADLKEQLGILAQLETSAKHRNNHIECANARSHFTRQAAAFDKKPQSKGRYQADNEAQTEAASSLGFQNISGIVTAAQRHSFQRQIYLISRGNSYTLFKDTSMADNDDSIFMVYYLGDVLDRQIRRLCQFMDIRIYMSSADEPREMSDLMAELNRETADNKQVIDRTRQNLDKKMLAINDKLQNWKIMLVQEKAIRVALNKFEEHDESLVCHGWVPLSKIDIVNNAMQTACAGKGVGNGVVTEIQAPPRATPPTHFDTNRFTAVFQSVIDTYGVPRYREYNPCPPTIITFPFLFAMMYGDIFHGSCVFLTAAYLAINEKKFQGRKLNELLDWLYCGRYLCLFMGMFAIYNGFIYNEIISLSFTLFADTSWVDHSVEDLEGGLAESGEFGEQTGPWTVTGVYPFGVDPVWHGRQLQIEFTNSIKMKLSVIFGVTQMTFGLILSASNHLEYKDYITLILEWIPQLIFMLSFFVYMIFMIFMKWSINWQIKEFAPPSLITALVNMILAAGQVDRDETQLFESLEFQEQIQFVGMICMLGSIPIMLFCKPFALWCKYGGKKGDTYKELDDGEDHKEEIIEDGGATAKTAADAAHRHDSMDDGRGKASKPKKSQGGGHGHGHGDGEFELGETFIHQMIHTIEYVLGTISNTASYLRLWALSLAHSQLAEVFYQKTLLDTMKSGGLTLFVGVVVFWGTTFGVLLVMDQLECFLHALRLHWVEFQNKFYYADGIAFEPYYYKAIAEPKEG